ncbi:hypothetical protein [Nesterenkonia natronophila]|uniref:PASTA domain-containing protein n=1 Tax=Nesterenkonia natronophila TaxID=2174932 RepID=A0A3A4F9K6_9MICC|nr:hypothetical protein [Nesterenkonia natronophila]RJN31877.1 hypothetical protein D3250_07110 [Nesterenkonia natronophila]
MTRTLAATAALAALALAACSSPNSGSDPQGAQSPASSPAATESTEDGADPVADLHRVDSAPGQSTGGRAGGASGTGQIAERPESAGPPTEPSGKWPEEQETAWEYSEDTGWYEVPVNLGVGADDFNPAPAPGPQIDVPHTDTCPYHEEVGAVDGSVSDQIDRALELGCELDIHGTVSFGQPLDAPANSSGTYSLTSVHDALSVIEMCEQGYIPADDPWCDPDFPG